MTTVTELNALAAGGLPAPAEMVERLGAMVREDPSIAVLSYLMPPELMLEWAHSIGVFSDAALRASVAPVPPHALRGIVAASQEELFLWTGARDVQTFNALYFAYGRPPEGRKPRVLDFGCGCGRMTRFFNMDRRYETFGSDINRSLVDWCRAELSHVTTKYNAVAPPLDFETGFFDFAFTLSIFTHLPEASAALWLEELARVSAKNALIIVTTHGFQALHTIRTSPVHHQMFGLDKDATDDIVRRLPDEGFVFLPYSEDVLAAAMGGASYGNVFIDQGYAGKHWNTANLEIVHFLPAGLRGWQDIYILRRK